MHSWFGSESERVREGCRGHRGHLSDKKCVLTCVKHNIRQKSMNVYSEHCIFILLYTYREVAEFWCVGIFTQPLKVPLLCPLSPLSHAREEKNKEHMIVLLPCLKMHFAWLFCLIFMAPQKNASEEHFPLKLGVPELLICESNGFGVTEL